MWPEVLGSITGTIIGFAVLLVLSAGFAQAAASAAFGGVCSFLVLWCVRKAMQ